MTDLEKILLRTIMNMGDVSDARQCAEHAGCIILHLSMGAPSEAPKPKKSRPKKQSAPEKDIEYTPQLAIELSTEFGKEIEIAHDAGTNNWVAIVDKGNEFQDKTLKGVVECVRQALG